MISDAKVIAYDHKQAKIECRTTYSGAVEPCSLKKKQRSGLYKPAELKPVSHVSKDKVGDVAGLLDKLGYDMKFLDFYKDVKVSTLPPKKKKNNNKDEKGISFINNDNF